MEDSTLKFLGDPVIVWAPASGHVSKLVIFLHGSGDTGPGVSNWLHSLGAKSEADSNDITVVFPTAPARPYTMFGGDNANVWHDRNILRNVQISF